MKERPMIFNAEMVRAILDGRKTQTRRIVKGVPESHNFHGWVMSSTCAKDEGKACWAVGKSPLLNQPIRMHCPFGDVGDRIWVRETFQGPLIPEDELSEFLGANPDKFESPAYCEYAADGGPRPEYVDADDNTRHGWRPAIYMPRWASRITLEITGVRVERLNSISQEDVQAEGMELTGWRPTYSDPDSGGEVWTPYDNFAQLWESIYGEESWQANPWVWVIDFKRTEGGAA